MRDQLRLYIDHYPAFTYTILHTAAMYDYNINYIHMMYRYMDYRRVMCAVDIFARDSDRILSFPGHCSSRYICYINLPENRTFHRTQHKCR